LKLANEMPCKHLVGYRETDRQNGVICDRYRFEHSCGVCGFNPAVQTKRLTKIVGAEKADELVAMSQSLSAQFKKEHPI